MRIIAGEFRSRQLDTLSGVQTRPTSDKIKEAIFSKLGPFFSSGSVLDAFGGSGSLALEALSRGMDQATIFDLSPQAMAVIKKNIAKLGIADRCTLMLGDAMKLINRLDTPFDLIFLDPPYAYKDTCAIIERIADRCLLKPQGTLIVESDRTQEIPTDRFLLFDSKSYGNTKISYFRLQDDQ